MMDNALQFIVKDEQAIRQRELRVGFNRAAGNIAQCLAVFGKNGPSGFLQTRVYAEYG